jgi:4-hydroxybenzoate-CoA ligase/benzoate-CoA ligase
MYNATNHFIDRHAGKTSGARVAYTDHTGDWTYQKLAAMVNQAGHVLSNLGLKAEQRMLMCMTDSVWFPAVFWGAIKIGAVPVPVNTMLTDADYAYMLNDSCARVLVVSESLYPKFVPHIDAQSSLGEVVIDGSGTDGRPSLSVLMESFEAELPTAPTKPGDAAFWLYTSGSTGQPKGVVHRHSDLVQTARLYGDGILKLDKSDVAFSAAKLFFAYGLGNGMSFPLHVGCRTVLLADRPTPESVLSVMKDQDVSIFFGVPTLYGAILSDNANDRSKVSEQLRLCVSAGEALPEEIGKEWERRFGVPILDGLGSTELLHIFLSNRPDDVRYGTTGRPVSGIS